MPRAAAVVLTLLLAACASMGRSKRCAPIDPESFLDYGGLYDECTVGQRARLIFAPRIEYPYQPPRGLRCVSAELRVVVDTLGRPLPETVQVAQANDARYVELMVNHLPQVRFSPGRVDGRAVHQIARWESRTAVRQLTARATTPSRSDSC